ncbi:MAG: hypothetical protein L6R40_001103 [Gallowayella cf. fulva]|nr:MAG: hypothetical protein L6R40_001103 [Xanthomendoza cf. fulva]
MATVTATIEFGQFPLQVRPQPLRLQSELERTGIVAAPPSPLSSRAISPQSSDRDLEKSDKELPPVDGGAAAWKFLFAGVMIEAFLFGFPLNYGIFQNYYFTHPPFEGNPNLSTVGTFGTAFYFLGAPVATYLVRRYHRWQREIIWAGCTISIIGLVAASFASDFGTLVATQGVIFGMGILILYYPIFSMLNEWWVERRGLALGILCAAAGVSGLFYPFVLEVLLNKYGPATTLRVSAVALTLLCGPVLPLLKGRYSASHHEKAPEMDYSFFKMPLFYVFSLVGLLQGLGFYFPMIYLPSYATSLGLSDHIGAALLVIYSFAQILGQLGFGYFSDLRVKRFWAEERIPVEILLFVSPLGTTLSPSPSLALITLSAFACVKGVGNVVTGPVSSALLTTEIHRDEYGLGRFKNIILYSGLCMLAGAAVMVGWWLWTKVVKWVERREESCGCVR